MSKLETLEKYGLTQKDLSQIRLKIDKQRDFLEQNQITTSKGETKSYLDFSYSANHSKRYYSRILNKVETFVSINLNKGLVPVFLTCTLDGFFRDFLKADYSRWDKNKEKYVLGKHIPNNDRYGHYLEMVERGHKFSSKDLYKILGYQLHRFTKSLSEIKRNDDSFSSSFLRVTEPHKDGVPHFHILLYIPAEYISKVYNEFHKYFPAPRNSERIAKHNTFGKNKRDGLHIHGDKYETFGFQIEIRSPIGYILKYILKSFVNLIEDKEIDYLQAWYIKKRIPRLISSHTLVSQDVYHKLAPLESCWYYLTSIKIDGGYFKSNDKAYFSFSDGTRRIVANNGYFSLYNNDRLVNTYGAYNYNYVMSSSKTFVFFPDRPIDFNYFQTYRKPFTKSLYDYSYEISLADENNVFLSCFGNDDFSLTIHNSDYVFIDDESFFFDSVSSSALEFTNNYIGIQSALYNDMVVAGDLDGAYMTGYDFLMNEISTYFNDGYSYV